jgi:dTDP-4-amino-4,6-dideoxygalactose transaminase
MRYPYYNPNLSLSVALRALFKSKYKAETSIKNYFSQLTGKKYILITNSCRTALYLAYKAIGMEGEVITTPLTCSVAIHPIEESKNIPVFADVNRGDLNINVDDIQPRITGETIAVQAVHLGGVSCDMDQINRIGKLYNLWIIEDCAQSLGAKLNNFYTGSFGHISCFSLIKNAYGIGGGILATDSIEIYDKVLNITKNFRRTALGLTLFRFIRNISETYRNYILGSKIHDLLLKMKGKKTAYQSVQGQLRNPSVLEIKVSAAQLARLNQLHQKRKMIGNLYFQLLKERGILVNSEFSVADASFTKFYVHNPGIRTMETIEKLHQSGIEAMHLEHKQGSPYQEKMVSEPEALEKNLYNYLKLNDKLISLPICENFSAEDIEFITSSL